MEPPDGSPPWTLPMGPPRRDPPWTGPQGTPLSLTPLSLRQVLEAINECAFPPSSSPQDDGPGGRGRGGRGGGGGAGGGATAQTDYPVILSFENHCTVDQQRVSAAKIVDHGPAHPVGRPPPRSTPNPSPWTPTPCPPPCTPGDGLDDDLHLWRQAAPAALAPARLGAPRQRLARGAAR